MAHRIKGSHYVLHAVSIEGVCTFSVSDAALHNWMARTKSSGKEVILYNALVSRFVNAQYASSRAKLNRDHLLDRELLRTAVSQGVARNEKLCYTLIHND